MPVKHNEIDLRFVAERIAEVVDDEPKSFAYEIGVSLSAVYNYLSGKRLPEVVVLLRIAQLTGKPMEWFLIRNNSEQ